MWSASGAFGKSGKFERKRFGGPDNHSIRRRLVELVSRIQAVHRLTALFLVHSTHSPCSFRISDIYSGFFRQFCLWWPRFVRTLHWGYSIIRCQESGRGQNCNLANGKFVYLLACLPVFCRQKSRNISGCKLLVHWSSNLPLGLIEPLWRTAGHN